MLQADEFEWLANEVGLYGLERDCLRLRVVDALPVAAIADQLHLPESAVIAHLLDAEDHWQQHVWPPGRLDQARLILQAQRNRLNDGGGGGEAIRGPILTARELVDGLEPGLVPPCGHNRTRTLDAEQAAEIERLREAAEKRHGKQQR